MERLREAYAITISFNKPIIDENSLRGAHDVAMDAVAGLSPRNRLHHDVDLGMTSAIVNSVGQNIMRIALPWAVLPNHWLRHTRP